jgi:protein-disulfide isomerase
MSTADRPTRLKSVLDVIATCAVLAASIVVVVMVLRRPTSRAAVNEVAVQELLPVEIVVGDSPRIGRDSAGVGVVVFSDFECPFCRAFSAERLPELRSRLLDGGRVLLVFKHFPLESLHHNARRLAELSACARPEKFWTMLEFFAKPTVDLTTATTEMIAPLLNTDVDQLRACAKSRGRTTVDADVALGHRLDVIATPSFFFGRAENGVIHATRRIEGNEPLAVFEKAISLIPTGRRP